MGDSSPVGAEILRAWNPLIARNKSFGCACGMRGFYTLQIYVLAVEKNPAFLHLS